MARRDLPAGVPTNPEGVAALVKHQVAEEWQESGLAPEPLDRCVHDAVATVAAGRVSTFAAVLALRRVRACARARGCDGDDF